MLSEILRIISWLNVCTCFVMLLQGLRFVSRVTAILNLFQLEIYKIKYSFALGC